MFWRKPNSKAASTFFDVATRKPTNDTGLSAPGTKAGRLQRARALEVARPSSGTHRREGLPHGRAGRSGVRPHRTLPRHAAAKALACGWAGLLLLLVLAVNLHLGGRWALFAGFVVVTGAMAVCALPARAAVLRTRSGPRSRPGDRPRRDRTLSETGGPRAPA